MLIKINMEVRHFLLESKSDLVDWFGSDDKFCQLVLWKTFSINLINYILSFKVLTDTCLKHVSI